jgi:AbrB family looped-hinge helix DNA binding protein
MRVTSKGQVTIPAEIRQRAGILPDTEVAFKFDGKKIELVRVGAKSGRKSRGQKIVEHLRGRGTGKLTTDQILALTRGR